MKVQYKKIPNGLDDIAEYLNLEPAKTIFLHSTSFNESTEAGKKRASINKGRMIYSEIMAYSSNKENGAKTAVSYIEKSLLEYYNENNIINIENIIQVGEDKKIDYPYNSVSYMLNKKVKEDEFLRKKLEGFTIVSSYLSQEDEETAKIINGKLLMKVDEQVKFNSKYFLKKISEKYRFSTPKGKYFCGLNNIENVIKILREETNNIMEDNIFWIKLESQLSGTGNIKIDINEDLQEIKQKVEKIASKIYTSQYINEEMPLIIEVDVNSMKNEKEIENIGVEAVISSDTVTILGGVSQETKNGSYIGSVVTDKTRKYIGIAQEVAKEAFIAYAKEGYRGFITIDVLIVQNSETGEIKGYNIDPNARFSAGTMLLKNIHTSEYYNNKPIYGLSFSNAVRLDKKAMETISSFAKNNLYKMEKSNYKGILPVVLNDVTQIVDDKYYLKTVTIEDSYEKVQEIYNNFKKEIRSYDSDRI